ncbi:hypothetical protein [Virgibacillus pantothenticus]|uniref:hypothetical protein n=1 Tax=Virgibacillus pantothenticus TaxID=1473 RepID=UPI001BAED5F3|nr:hypothetical protein [Virgibacillus pantothenticus]
MILKIKIIRLFVVLTEKVRVLYFGLTFARMAVEDYFSVSRLKKNAVNHEVESFLVTEDSIVLFDKCFTSDRLKMYRECIPSP